MLIEEIGPHGHVVSRHRASGAGAECRVGRDLGSDLVLDDEHAASTHAAFTLLEDGRVRVRDLGSRNGTRVDGARLGPADERIVERAEVIVGRTRLRLRTARVPLADERPFQRDALRRHRTALAIAGVCACVAYAVFQAWLDAPTALGRSGTTAALTALGLIALWTGPWTLTTKLNLGSWQVRVHLAIVTIGAALCVWGHWLAGVVAFAAQWTLLDAAGLAVVSGALLAALYLHLRNATSYGRRTALAIAATLTLAIGTTAWLVQAWRDDGDVNRVELGPDVMFLERRVVPNRDPADYLADVEELRRAAARNRQQSLLETPLADADD